MNACTAARTWLFLAFGGLPLAGCAGLLHDVESEPRAPVALSERFRLRVESSSVAAGRWWEAFRDPGLDAMVGAALADSLDLRRGFARLEQAEAAARGASAGLWPQLGVEAGISRSQQVFNFAGRNQGAGGPAPGPFSVVQDQQNISVSASYEVDLWGRVKNTAQAAKLELFASRSDVEAVAMTLTANLAEVWFQLAEARAARALLEAQEARNRTFLELVETRFGQGQASALEVFQQRQQLAATRAQVPLLEARLLVLRHQLAVLLARPPTAELPMPAELPTVLPPLPEEGLPLELLRRRPDVRAAEARAVAADHRVGAAIAERFPTLRLTASTGFRGFEVRDLFDGWLWNLAGGLVGPLFDGGRRAAEVDRARAVVEEQLLGFGQTLLVAMREVEDALVQERAQRLHLERLEEQLLASRTTLDEARRRYLEGLTDYLPVLTALESQQAVEQRLVAARRQRLSFRVQLARALGGTWTQSLVAPPSLEERAARETESAEESLEAPQ